MLKPALVPAARLFGMLFRRFGQPYLRGHYEVNGNQLYVNRGLGFGRGGRHLRIDSEPELALLTLRRAPDDEVLHSSVLREQQAS